MKKIKRIHAILIAALTLVIGFFIGLYVDYPKTDKKDLAGTIGKVDRYRNVQVTEDDIKLRNELLDDTAKRAQYERYLTYYYYYAVRTASDLQQVLNATDRITSDQKQASNVQELLQYQAVLKKMETYLGTSRVEILTAIDAVSSLDTTLQIPVIFYLNNAQDAIARIRSFDGAILGYINAISSYLSANPLLSTPELQDAHDILVLNMTTAAVVAQDKPTLRYLDKKKLMNNEEGVRELVAAETFKATLQGVIASDLRNISGDQQLLNMDELGLFLNDGLPVIADQIVAGLTTLLDASRIGNQETISLGIASQEQIGLLRLFDNQFLGFII
ncbi:MAG: hypothetical protein R6V49_06185 [Bacteroidales bacterium]